MNAPQTLVKTLALTLALCACATSSVRLPASTPDDEQSVEFAKKLNGGSVKFRAFRADSQVSILGSLDLSFKNCQVVVNAESSDGTGKMPGSYIDCDVEINTDPIQASFKAKVQGDQRSFTVSSVMQKDGVYNLDVEINMVWQNNAWTGQGKVTGNFNKQIGNNGSVSATVNETLSF